MSWTVLHRVGTLPVNSNHSGKSFSTKRDAINNADSIIRKVGGRAIVMNGGVPHYAVEFTLEKGVKKRHIKSTSRMMAETARVKLTKLMLESKHACT